MLSVRRATLKDGPAIVQIEKAVWGRAGAPFISLDIFHQWMATYPQGFFVALRDGELCGYSYMEVVHFDPDQFPAEVGQLSGGGYAACHHASNGNTLFGVSVVAHPANQGAGKALLKTALEFGARCEFKYLITLSRMPGLSSFVAGCRGLEGQQDIDQLAQQYAVACMQLVGGKVAAHLHGSDQSTTPAISERDPVLCRFATLTHMSLHSIVESSFPDPESCNRAALMVHTFNT